MEWIGGPEIWASLLTLTALEIVLGIDNLVFLAILTGRLPVEQQARARYIGLMLALVSRLALLASIAWMMRLTEPLFEIFQHAVSWRDLILVGGGVFLIHKATTEIHRRLEGEETEGAGATKASFGGVVGQIVLLDMVFSLDSVITAVGMANDLAVMAAAIVIAVIVMLAAAKPLVDFVERHPTVKMLALSFLFMIGMTLIADGVGFHIPKGYIYAAIAFAIAVEALNHVAARRMARQKRRIKEAR